MNKILIAFLVLLAFPAVALAHHQSDHDGGHTPVTICHATGSATNPYVVITVDIHAVDGGGENDHSSHAGDIIPAPADGCPTGETTVTEPTEPTTETPPAVETPENDSKTEAGDSGSESPKASPEPAERDTERGELPRTGTALNLIAFLGGFLLGFGFVMRWKYRP